MPATVARAVACCDALLCGLEVSCRQTRMFFCTSKSQVVLVDKLLLLCCEAGTTVGKEKLLVLS